MELNINNYEDGLRRMIYHGLLTDCYDWDLVQRIFNTCMANHLLSETFFREFWKILPTAGMRKEYFSKNFLREMNIE